jgi:hypothetical protein
MIYRMRALSDHPLSRFHGIKNYRSSGAMPYT